MRKCYSTRDNCRLCNSKELELAVPLGKTPVSEKYITKENLTMEQEKVPLDLYFCADCSHVQLLDVVNPDYLWSDFTFKTNQKPALKNHMQDFAKKMESFSLLSNDSLIIDVGSNDGTLLQCFREVGHENVLGVDPVKEIAEEASRKGIPTIAGYMDQHTAEYIYGEFGQADLVTAFNVYAHADDLAAMTETIKTVLTPAGLFVFEVSYLLDVIQKMLIGTIFHEHLSYHSVTSMDRFLKFHGLELIHVERVPEQGGSIVGFVQIQGGSFKRRDSVKNILKTEREFKLDKIETIKNFSHSLESLKNEVCLLIKNIQESKKTIAGYGAARSGTTLLSYFKIGGEIEYIVDDNSDKHFKYSPGDKIEVLPTQTIYERKPDYLLILAWMHTDTIIENHTDYMKDGGEFIRLFPELEIIKI